MTTREGDSKGGANELIRRRSVAGSIHYIAQRLEQTDGDLPIPGLIMALRGIADGLADEGERQRLGRIADAHGKEIGRQGTTSGLCGECGWTWPCPTYVWATTDRDPLATWDPADDEGDQS